MKAKVAVATVNGKTYFLVVNELKRRKIPFFSVVPGEPLPTEVNLVITTEKEKALVTHCNILVYNSTLDPEVLGGQVVRMLQGKEHYENLVVGIDPGEVFGVTVIADDEIIESENCLSMRETVNKVNGIIKNFNLAETQVTIKVGNGVPLYKDLLRDLDQEMPTQVNLEIIEEFGTNRYFKESKHRRGFRHLISATRIAQKAGYAYPRGRLVEENS